MKIVSVLLLAVLLTGCFNMFDEKPDKLFVYKLDGKSNIQVYSVGFGATTNGHTEIRKTSGTKSVLLKRIGAEYYGYKTNLLKINDTLYKITFTDTSTFKGMSKSFNFNINEKVKE